MRSIRAKIVLLAAASTLIVALALSGVFIAILRTSINDQVVALETTLRDDYDQQIKSEVETAVSMLERLARLRDSGALSKKDALDLARNLLRDLRYHGDNYFWADTPKGDNILAGSSELSEASKQMATGISGIADSSQQLSQGATEQAASAEEVSASVEEMSANIRQNADNSFQTEKISAKAAGDAKEGLAAVRETVVAMRQIAEKIAIIEDDCSIDKHAVTEREHRGGAGRRTRQGLCGGRQRGGQARGTQQDSGRRDIDIVQAKRRRGGEGRSDAAEHGA